MTISNLMVSECVALIFILFLLFMVLTKLKRCVIYMGRTTIVLQKMYELMSGVDMSNVIELEEKPETPAVPDDTWE